MANGTRSPLEGMRVFAHFVDENLKELNQSLSSVDFLMAREENRQGALDLMQGIFENVQAMNSNTQQLKTQLQSALASVKAENEKAVSRIQSVQDGITQIENTLTKYGFDSTSMPKYDPEVDLVHEDSSANMNNDDDSESDLEQEDHCEQGLKSPSHLDVNELSESMAGVEITPLVLSSKSRSSSAHGHILTPSIIITPCRKEYASGSVKNVKRAPKHNEKDLADGKENRVSPKLPYIPIKPKFPIYSKETYELLGQDPPPEFFEGCE